MKSIIVTGLLAVIGLSIFADPADARFRRRRSCNTCATACNNGCNANGQAMYDPNDPNAQYAGPNGAQPNTTFYRGQPNGAPPPAPNANIQNQNGQQPRLAPQADRALNRAENSTQEAVDKNL